jgi:uncharacterized protein YigA (DUF484 family)
MPKTQEIIDYLKQHPSFFVENEELLTYLEFGAEKGSTPFYERQLQVLKDRESRQKSQIDLIVDSARNNQKLESDLLEMAVRLLSNGKNGGDPAGIVVESVKSVFNVNEAVILLDNLDENSMRQVFEQVRQRVIHKSSICDDRVSSNLLEALFQVQGNEVRSCAFVPLLYSNEINGIMVLGAAREERFQPGIGVLYLDRLGLLVGSFLQGATD